MTAATEMSNLRQPLALCAYGVGMTACWVCDICFFLVVFCSTCAAQRYARLCLVACARGCSLEMHLWERARPTAVRAITYIMRFIVGRSSTERDWIVRAHRREAKW